MSGRIILTSLISHPVITHILNLRKGKSKVQYHLSLCDSNFSKYKTRQELLKCNKISVPQKLIFNTREQIENSINILSNLKFDILVLHGGSNILKNIKKYKLSNYLKKIVNNKICVAISTSRDIIIKFNFCPNINIFDDWEIYENNKTFYQNNIFQKSPKDIRVPIKQYIAEHELNSYLLYKDSFIEYYKNQLIPHGRMKIIKNKGEVYEYYWKYKGEVL